MNEDPYAAWRKVREQRRLEFMRESDLVVGEQPRRAKITARIANRVWKLLHTLPDRISQSTWVHGRSTYDSRVDDILGATACRVFGHFWDVCVPGVPPNSGHLMICAGCNSMPSTDDLDAFHPGSRDRRDFAALAAELDALHWSIAVSFPMPRQEAA